MYRIGDTILPLVLCVTNAFRFANICATKQRIRRLPTQIKCYPDLSAPLTRRPFRQQSTKQSPKRVVVRLSGNLKNFEHQMTFIIRINWCVDPSVCVAANGRRTKNTSKRTGKELEIEYVPNATSCGLGHINPLSVRTHNLSAKPPYLRRHCTRPISAAEWVPTFWWFRKCFEKSVKIIADLIYCDSRLFSTSTFPPSAHRETRTFLWFCQKRFRFDRFTSFKRSIYFCRKRRRIRNSTMFGWNAIQELEWWQMRF